MAFRCDMKLKVAFVLALMQVTLKERDLSLQGADFDIAFKFSPVIKVLTYMYIYAALFYISHT